MNLETLKHIESGTDHPQIRLTGSLTDRFGEESAELIMVGGAITTKDRLANFIVSLAYVNADGSITCYGQEIGQIRQIELLEEGG